MLGRPFGVPNDAAFQGRVLVAALRLLEASSGPVLADFPEDAPAPHDAGGQTCPVSFGTAHSPETAGAAFEREVDELTSWYDLARERRGRTGVGLSGVAIAEAAKRLQAFASTGAMPALDGLNAGEALKLLLEDVRTYYYEAAAARPGAMPSAVEQWFWNETAASRIFFDVHRRCDASEDASLQRLCATSIVPRSIVRQQNKRSPA